MTPLTQTRKALVMALLIIAAAAFSAAAQRRVNPVKPATPVKTAPVAGKPDRKGNIVFLDTVTGEAIVDSTSHALRPGNIYPRWHSLNIGVDIWDPVMCLLGQDYGVGGAFVSLSIHNRVFPLIEAGLGRASLSPDGGNYSFHTPLAPFFKIGLDYNVFYNNNPSYALLVGLRYGFSPFRWGVDDVTLPPSYWGPGAPFVIPEHSATAGFIEVSFGVRVKLIGPISAGWQFKFRSLIHESNDACGRPMYIPGFGKRSTPISGAFTIVYTLPLSKGTVNRPELRNVDTQSLDPSATLSSP